MPNLNIYSFIYLFYLFIMKFCRCKDRISFFYIQYIYNRECVVLTKKLMWLSLLLWSSCTVFCPYINTNFNQMLVVFNLWIALKLDYIFFLWLNHEIVMKYLFGIRLQLLLSWLEMFCIMHELFYHAWTPVYMRCF